MGGNNNTSNSHETLQPHSPDRTASDKNFGVTFAVVFALAAAYCAHNAWIAISSGFALASLLIGITAFVRPKLLAPANRAWTWFGFVLHKVVNPLIMAAMFYGVFTPMGFSMRLFGFHPLGRKRRGTLNSYWIRRDPKARERTDMTQQF